MNNLDDILRKVQALIAQADHPNTGPVESETFRNKAEALMLKYRIDEMMLSTAEKQQMGVSVQWRQIVVCDARNEFRSFYVSIVHALVRHFDIRADYVRTEGRIGGDMMQVRQQGLDYVINMVGYESDLRFVEAMFTAASLAFSKRLEPKYDPTLSDQVNAYLMRSAGMEGWRIAKAIYGRDDKALRPKVRAMFKAEAIERGEDPSELLGRGSNMKLFRESYASGFTNEFDWRLRRMRQANSGTGEMVLASRKENIDEAFYAKFPERRPKPVDRQLGQADYKACPKCAKAKSGYCRDHLWMRPKKSRVLYANDTAYGRGQFAARSVDLGITGRDLT